MILIEASIDKGRSHLTKEKLRRFSSERKLDKDKIANPGLIDLLTQVELGNKLNEAISHFKDPYEDTFSAILVAVLADIADQRVINALLAALEKQEINILIGAIVTLGEIGTTQAVEPLVHLLSHKSAKVREVVAIALGDIADPQAFEYLLLRINDRVCLVRLLAVAALKKMPDERLIEPFIQLFRKYGKYFDEDDDCSYIGERIIDTLKLIKDERVFGFLVEVLKNRFEYPIHNLAHIVEALGEFKSEATYGLLTEIVKSDDNNQIRTSAIYGLEKLGDRRCIPLLMQVLGEDDEDIQFAGMVALGRFKVKEAVPLIAPFLSNDDSIMTRIAIRVLGEIEDKEALDYLIPLLNNYEFGYKAQEAINQIKGKLR